LSLFLSFFLFLFRSFFFFFFLRSLYSSCSTGSVFHW
jgi:hypothetical protein